MKTLKTVCKYTLRLLKYTFLFLLAAIILASVLLYIFWPGIEGRYLKPTNINNKGMAKHFSELVENGIEKASPEMRDQIKQLECHFRGEEYTGAECVSPLIYLTGFQMDIPHEDIYCENNYYIRTCRQAYFHEVILNNPKIHEYIKYIAANPCDYLYKGINIPTIFGCGDFLAMPVWLTYVDNQGNFVKNEIVE